MYDPTLSSLPSALDGALRSLPQVVPCAPSRALEHVASLQVPLPVLKSARWNSGETVTHRIMDGSIIRKDFCSWESKRPTAKTVASLQELVQEGIRLTIDTGPEGVTRGFQATRAVFGVGQSYVETLLRGDKPDPPVVVLRVLFEKLGATYIKLGQFIASSPSLFPAEYVTEFQKCLDKTEPVPFDKIKATIAAELDQPIDEVLFHILPSTSEIMMQFA
jgi:hypothetical protein